MINKEMRRTLLYNLRLFLAPSSRVHFLSNYLCLHDFHVLQRCLWLFMWSPVSALANLPALYHVVIYRDCKRYFHDYALFLGNIDPCHIVHANRSSSWICFGCQPFYHCRSNLLMTQAHHNLHKSNVTNERLADGLFYGLGVLGDKHQAKTLSF